jgi:hypothetical protein
VLEHKAWVLKVSRRRAGKSEGLFPVFERDRIDELERKIREGEGNQQDAL